MKYVECSVLNTWLVHALKLVDWESNKDLISKLPSTTSAEVFLTYIFSPTSRDFITQSSVAPPSDMGASIGEDKSTPASMGTRVISLFLPHFSWVHTGSPRPQRGDRFNRVTILLTPIDQTPWQTCWWKAETGFEKGLFPKLLPGGGIHASWLNQSQQQ